MSFYYILPANIQTGFSFEQPQEYCSKVNSLPDPGFGDAQKMFLPSAITAAHIGMGDFACLSSQQAFVIPTYPSFGQLQTDTHEVKQPKKRQRNAEKQIESAKKNSESNLINQFFSFFSSREKSERTVEAIIASISKQDPQREKLLHLFYNSIQVVNARRGRKYVNRKILVTLFQPAELLKAMPEIEEKVEKISEVSIEELCRVFRKCCFSFYRTCSIESILTSKRISAIAKEQHFRKRRKLLSSLYQDE